MKPLLTIIATCLCCGVFAQSDSFLQSLIDSAKSGVHRTTSKDSGKRTVQPSTKDTTKKSVQALPLRRDSGRTVRKDSLQTQQVVTAAGRSETDTSKATSADSALADTMATALPAAVISRPIPWLQDTAFAHLLTEPFTRTKFVFVLKEGEVHVRHQKDYLFYVMIAVLLLFAIIKQLYPKYYQNVFKLVFQASFRQKQTREQMMQQALPALLMNVQFIIVAGLFIALVAQLRNWLNISFWLLTTYCVTLLALVYIFKYLVIQFMGWVFNAREQATTYGFIVFLVNKVIGLALLPLLCLLAFTPGGGLQQVTLTLAAVIVILLLIFRYVVSMTVIRNTLSVHPLHFFIYLCAIELMPMLILYKVLFSFVGKS